MKVLLVNNDSIVKVDGSRVADARAALRTDA